MIAMILAAGRGERLRPLTDSTPKSLVEIRGRSLLERHLVNIRHAGVETVVINLGWLGAEIVRRVGCGARYGLQVIYSQEGDNVLETGGGIHKALPLLGSEPFLVLNADIYTDMPIPAVELAADVVGHLVMVPTPAYRDHGDFDLQDGRIRNSRNPKLTFSGVAVYKPEFFDGCEAGRFPLAPMLRGAADAGRLSGETYAGLWADVGTMERLEALNRA
ncbi:MAG: nucleotidyltransferase family protein [Gammaproteobacteria bacterium]|nr:nucleotidyltransferase family protein [Gammaproteobacteria bacterium]MBT8109187.1 nucleotidyltransferase family protein [Gammaproteobacteria bacterium]NND48233.1 nucleotidyltransferase family protein [Woeseiaceae bacterium]NNL43890.1 nucleotidyltransferase family protein [Woeseiaceae bacterium]